ncbi:hypothetical protein PFBG_02962 [Plasmodium falciparum 7G8]|uniref:Uncharacterized protein n=1 Tax=Plasmodium falciparum (isolate 7G8) TaxID=57266 RepID=W7F7C8_PLAF8|nr:hypothetical protein PFBG_02962 [Plasmodium falciparum 7G8]
MVIFNVVILIINEILKKVEERIKINRQKYLKVLFGTRLGIRYDNNILYIIYFNVIHIANT